MSSKMKGAAARIQAVVRKTIERAVLDLKAERDRIDADLAELLAMLGPVEKKRRRGKSPVATARGLLGRGEVTAGRLAAATGQSKQQAAQTLAYLAKRKVARRVRPGVYAGAK